MGNFHLKLHGIRMSKIELYQEDCLLGMKRYPDKWFDMILCDLPYGTTHNKWDTIIPFKPLWEQYKRIIKDNGAIVLFGQDKFSARLMLFAETLHRYNLIWEKTDRPSGFLNANKMPLRSHEDILVFYKSLPIYNPQWEIGNKNHSRGHSRGKKQTNNCYGKFNQNHIEVFTNKKFPRSILKFSREHPPLHPTQKPITLFEYLIKTYTNERDLVLDNCMGSGTTAIACYNLQRNFIGMEINKEYYEIAKERLENHMKQQRLFEK